MVKLQERLREKDDAVLKREKEFELEKEKLRDEFRGELSMVEGKVRKEV